jgi:hypothetical protein
MHIDVLVHRDIQAKRIDHHAALVLLAKLSAWI